MSNNLFNLPQNQQPATAPASGKQVPLRYINLETDVSGNGDFVNLFDFGLSLNTKNAYAQLVNEILLKCQTDEELVMVMTYFLNKTRVKSVVDPSHKKELQIDANVLMNQIFQSMQQSK